MFKAFLAGVVGLCAVAAALAAVMAIGLQRLQRAEAVAVSPPSVIVPATPAPAVQPRPAPAPQAPTTRPAVRRLEPKPMTKRAEVAAAAPVPRPAAPAPPKGVDDPLGALRRTLLDPAASMERKQAAVVELARTEAGAAALLRLTEEGRLSAALQGLAVERLYQNSAALAGGVAWSP